MRRQVLEFEIPLEPMAWDRGTPQPLMRKVGKGVIPVLGKGGRPVFRVLKSARNRKYETAVEKIVKALKVTDPFLCPVSVEMVFQLTKPKSKRRKTFDPFPYADAKPDIDNMAKLIMDCMNGVVYKDDGQVIRLHLLKEWANDEAGARTIVRVEEVESSWFTFWRSLFKALTT